jgi:CTP synthase
MKKRQQAHHDDTSWDLDGTRWVVITGGVISGLGKGIVTASIGKLLSAGLRVVPVKCDGYLNVDPGTMNPIEHGEVFVLDDGGEVDMDFGHYERFIGITCKSPWNLTMGRVFKTIIDKERHGDFLGKTVQMIPHVTDEILERFFSIARAERADIVLIEIGGTVGDIENQLYLEAVRQLRFLVSPERIAFVHLTLVPALSSVGEPKTKPTQQSVSLLRERGIQPDIIIGRSDRRLDEKTKDKIALFTNVARGAVFSNPEIETVYELPLILEHEGLSRVLQTKLRLYSPPDLRRWEELVSTVRSAKEKVRIAVCGKYTALHDSYVSVIEALTHAGAHAGTSVGLKWIETTDVEERAVTAAEALSDVDGVIIPGGFGTRGVEGKIEIIRYAREHGIPFLGLCLGMQLAILEFARHVLGLKGAHSTEFVPRTKHPVIDLMPEQKRIREKGASMRLGACAALTRRGSLVRALYGSEEISERHRHRYEVNPRYHRALEEGGMILSALSCDRRLVEFVELPDHPYFVATQSHPELKSTLLHPAPLFLGLVRAALKARRAGP